METASSAAALADEPVTAMRAAPDSHLIAGGTGLRGHYVPSNPISTDLGLGVVHLYRDGDAIAHADLANYSKHAEEAYIPDEDKAYVDKDHSTLCILAVPSYMTPADLLGWIGEETADGISHLRLVKSERANKYMVLMKFRESDKAKAWQKLWNGKPFNSLEPENCHVVFVKSIQFQYHQAKTDASSFPDRTNDPFVPALRKLAPSSNTSKPVNTADTSSYRQLTSKPAPPPTPALVELPTCPVCLERMDETTGLATIFCQHVFHCACLQKWKNSGCPVCRYTQGGPTSRADMKKASDITECAVCGSRENLWICLICGVIGCGRYDEAHAFAHYSKTGHAFAMDIGTQHIWDYAGDEYVHRLIQNKSDGMLLDLPSTARDHTNRGEDMVPIDKMENMTLEYTYLITSQLDSQRLYYEQQLARAIDKASSATLALEASNSTATSALSRIEALQASQQVLETETIPSLEKDRERNIRRAEKFETMARHMQKEWKEKEVINESLMERINWLEQQLEEGKGRERDLEDQNRDLSFFISGMEKVQKLDDDVQEDLKAGTVSVGDKAEAKEGKGRKKKK